jgi:hypothetical protein
MTVYASARVIRMSARLKQQGIKITKFTVMGTPIEARNKVPF